MKPVQKEKRTSRKKSRNAALGSLGEQNKGTRPEL